MWSSCRGANGLQLLAVSRSTVPVGSGSWACPPLHAAKVINVNAAEASQDSAGGRLRPVDVLLCPQRAVVWLSCLCPPPRTHHHPPILSRRSSRADTCMLHREIQNVKCWIEPYLFPRNTQENDPMSRFIARRGRGHMDQSQEVVDDYRETAQRPRVVGRDPANTRFGTFCRTRAGMPLAPTTRLRRPARGPFVTYECRGEEAKRRMTTSSMAALGGREARKTASRAMSSGSIHSSATMSSRCS